jgi:hypothetical protein
MIRRAVKIRLWRLRLELEQLTRGRVQEEDSSEVLV